MGPKPSHLPALLTSILCLADPAPAQTRHLKFLGETTHEYLGTVLSDAVRIHIGR